MVDSLAVTKTLLATFAPLVLLLGCGGKVVFVGGDGAGGAGASGPDGGGVTCGEQICDPGNQCCCGQCLTLDLPCQEPCEQPPPACEGPYHVTNAQGDCVWSCGEGTQPDTVSNECVCQPGLVEVGVDDFGRRICALP